MSKYAYTNAKTYKYTLDELKNELNLYTKGQDEHTDIVLSIRRLTSLEANKIKRQANKNSTMASIVYNKIKPAQIREMRELQDYKIVLTNDYDVTLGYSVSDITYESQISDFDELITHMNEHPDFLRKSKPHSTVVHIINSSGDTIYVATLGQFRFDLKKYYSQIFVLK